MDSSLMFYGYELLQLKTPKRFWELFDAISNSIIIPYIKFESSVNEEEMEWIEKDFFFGELGSL